MIEDSAWVIGILFFAGIYLLLGKTKKEMVFGVVLLSNAINLLIVITSGSPLGKLPPILKETGDLHAVDPLPQALVLTAIVIGFGMLALLIAMVYKIVKKESP